MYYKVIRDGKSFRGNSLVWSLPVETTAGNWIPGDWHQHSGDLEMGHSGLHLTLKPAKWWHKGASCYEAEFQGSSLPGLGPDDGSGDIVCRRVRLLRKVTENELHEHTIFNWGSHEVTSGYAVACADVHLIASGCARVTAYDRVTVIASGQAGIAAFDNVRVKASDFVRITAFDDTHIEASSNVQITKSSERAMITVLSKSG